MGERVELNSINELKEAYEQCGRSYRAAAKKLGVSEPGLRRRLQAAERKGLVYGTSTLYRHEDGSGDMVLQWVKEKHGTADWEAVLRKVFTDIGPVKPIPLVNKRRSSDLLAVYPIGDQHHGMYAWGAETGADYDLKISKRLLVSAVEHLLNVTPDTEEGLLIDVGDFLHVDNLKNETSRSGHTLDVDTRHPLMIETGIELLRTCIDMGLQKHKRMKVICTPGNHNDIGGMWLQLALQLAYEKNPRVVIDRTPGKFHYHQHGKVLIGVTHGDTGKPEKLGGVMAVDKPELWGATRHRYWMTGHVHNRSVVELQGVMWETFRTLASRDGWAQASGYRSGRDMTSIIMHKEHGEIARHRFDVSMLQEAA